MIAHQRSVQKMRPVFQNAPESVGVGYLTTIQVFMPINSHAFLLIQRKNLPAAL